MKTRLVILLSVLLGAGALLSPSAKAISVEVNVGDRPYYAGRDFWDYGWHWVWVPGHYQHHHWVHGYYVRQGNWNHGYLGHHHHWQHSY